MHQKASEWKAAVFWEMMGSRILRNSWRKMVIDWFPGLGMDEDDVEDGDEGKVGNGKEADKGGNENNDDDYKWDESLFRSDDDKDSNNDGANGGKMMMIAVMRRRHRGGYIILIKILKN
jgi:hypothetical protein